MGGSPSSEVALGWCWGQVVSFKLSSTYVSWNVCLGKAGHHVRSPTSSGTSTLCESPRDRGRERRERYKGTVLDVPPRGTQGHPQPQPPADCNCKYEREKKEGREGERQRTISLCDTLKSSHVSSFSHQLDSRNRVLKFHISQMLHASAYHYTTNLQNLKLFFFFLIDYCEPVFVPWHKFTSF